MRQRELRLQQNRRFGYDYLNMTKNIISQERRKKGTSRQKILKHILEYFRKKRVKMRTSETVKLKHNFISLLSTAELGQARRNQKS